MTPVSDKMVTNGVRPETPTELDIGGRCLYFLETSAASEASAASAASAACRIASNSAGVLYLGFFRGIPFS